MTWCATRLAWVLAVGLAACSRETATEPSAGPLPPEGTVAVDFHTDQPQYTIGASAKTIMVNRSPDTFVMGVCSDVLERDNGTQWVEVSQPLIACPALAIIVNPGDSITLSLDLKLATTPATYRVRRQFSVLHGATSESTYRRSNTFLIVR